MSQQILNLLAKASSQNPMSVSELVSGSGLLPKTLNMILDSMYAAHSINQAMLTRNGIEQRVVWPTGVVSKLSGHIVITTPNKITPPRRDEKPITLPKVEPSPIEVQPETKPEEATNMNIETKPKVLQMLEFIEANANCSMQEVQLAIGDKMLGESYIKGYVKDGRVLITKNGIGKKLFSIAPGLKVANFYGTKVINKAPKLNANKPAASTGSYVENTDTPVLNLTDTKPTPVSGIVQAPAQSGAFRCAYTNDGCLLLLGIQVLPIELNAAQTNDLIEYISETVTPIGVSI